MPDWTPNCPPCPNKATYRAIGGDGPRPSRALIVLERPGREENRYGRVACGPTGQELDETYLPMGGFDRSDVRVCNTVLCGADNNKKPDDKLSLACAQYHLRAEIESTNPEVIFLCGATPCSLVPKIKLDVMHGIPQHTSRVGSLFGWSGWLVPMFHPALGLHESRFMQQIMEDWAGIKGNLSGGPLPSKRTDYRLDYRLEDGTNNVDFGRSTPLGVDTESHAGRLWSIQISAEANKGILLKADNGPSMALARHLLHGRRNTIFHNAVADIEPLRKDLSITIDTGSMRDTMQEAFQLGNLPQGLKALSYRLFGVEMTSWRETVWPASIRVLQEWLTEALLIAQRDFVTYIQRPRSVQVSVSKFESLVVRLLRNMDPAKDYDPWGDDEHPRLNAWRANPDNDRDVSHIESRIGPYPLPGIANCRLEKAIQYAVGDADMTGQVAAELAERRQGAFKINEQDRDGFNRS